MRFKTLPSALPSKNPLPYLDGWAALLAFFIFFVLPGCGGLSRSLEGSSPALRAPANLIRVPLVRQATDYTCGVSALQSILYYYGKEFREEELSARLQATPEKGTPYARMAELARSLNFRVETRTGLTLDEVKRLIDRGQPVILLVQAWPDTPVDLARSWEDGHYVVAVGYDRLNIYFMDPSTLGHYAFIPIPDFLARWHDLEDGAPLEHFGMVITPEAPGPLYNPALLKPIR